MVNVPKQEGSPWYQDVLKTLLGTFIGAVLAFVSAVLHRRTQQRNADIAAGNMALFYLRAMQRQTTEMRLGVRADISFSSNTYGCVPEWAILRPSINKPDESLKIDFQSLSFLTDSALGQDALLHARHAQELYELACHAFGLQQESAISYQEKLREVGDFDAISVDGKISWDLLKERIGGVLIGNRTSFFWAHLRNLEVNPAISRNAFELLQGELIKRFGGRVWRLKIDPSPTDNRAEGNLPALPTHLQEYVDSQRGLEQRVRSQAGEGAQ